MSATRNPVDPVDDLVIVKTVTIPVPVRTAFALFTEAPLLESWLCDQAKTDLHVGGRYELFWDLKDPTSDSTIGCRITAFEPDRVVAFQWRSPRQFKAFANAADPLTHVVVTFHGSEPGAVVTLLHSGWRSTADWAQAAAWQARAWDNAFRALQDRAAGLAQGAAREE